MALKDRIINLDDIRAYGPDEDPILYVPSNWTGVLNDVFAVPGVATSGKVWVVSQFFSERNHRQWVYNCVKAAIVNASLQARPFFQAQQANMQAAIDGTLPFSVIRDAVLEELKIAGANQANNAGRLYARILWGIRWLLEPGEYRERSRNAIHDVVQTYAPNKDLGWDMVKTKLLAILATHP